MYSKITGGLLAATLTLVVAACGTATSGGGADAEGVAAASPRATAPGAPTIARPAMLSHLPLVELVGPGALGAGDVPMFEWKGFEGAVAYRLSVLGPTGPRWGWQGTATTIRYGGVVDGQPGPTLVPGSFWSVAAVDADGSMVALSELRAVSPGDDPGSAPLWGAGLPAPSAPTSSSSQATIGSIPPICEIATPEEIGEILGRTLKPGVPDVESLTGTQDCVWSTNKVASVRISIGGKGAYFPTLWAGEDYEPIPGLGDDSYVAKSGMDYKVGLLKGDTSVLVQLDFGSADPDAMLELAKLIESRIP